MAQQEINSYSLWLFEGFTTLFFVFMAVSHQGSTTHEKERDENHLGSVCKVRTQDPENFDEEVKSLVTA